MTVFDVRVICLVAVLAAVAWLVYMFWRIRRDNRPGPRWPGDP